MTSETSTTTLEAEATPAADMSWVNQAPPVPTIGGVPVLLQNDIYSSPAVFEHSQRIARSLQASSLIPSALKKNFADVLGALAIAREMNAPPIMVMQNIFFVQGTAGWKTQFLIARANLMGVFKSRINWRVTRGDKPIDLKVTAFATMSDDTVAEVEVTFQMAMAEKWVKNEKYQTMPEHMLKWRSAGMLLKLYAPEILFGLPTVEELEDGSSMVDITPAGQAAKAALSAFAEAEPERRPSKRSRSRSDATKLQGEQKGDDVQAFAEGTQWQQGEGGEGRGSTAPAKTVDVEVVEVEEVLECATCRRRFKGTNAKAELAEHMTVHDDPVQVARRAGTGQAISSGGDREPPADDAPAPELISKKQGPNGEQLLSIDGLLAGLDKCKTVQGVTAFATQRADDIHALTEGERGLWVMAKMRRTGEIKDAAKK